MSQKIPDEMITSWLLDLERLDKAPRTVCKYRDEVRRFNAWLADRSESWEKLPATSAADYFSKHLFSLRLSSSSRRAAISGVRSFYRWARRAGLCAVDPCSSIELPKSRAALPRTASQSDLDSLLANVDVSTFLGLRDACIITLLAGTGIRVGTLCRLNTSHLTWEQIDNLNRLFISVHTKGSREIVLPVPIECSVLIQAYMAHPEYLEIDAALDYDDRVLFVSTRNRSIDPFVYVGERRRISARSVDDMIKKYAERAGIRQSARHAHAFRHLFGTELKESDTEDLDLMTLMGHADIRTTRIYAHLSRRRLMRISDSGNPLAKSNSGLATTARAITTRLKETS